MDRYLLTLRVLLLFQRLSIDQGIAFGGTSNQLLDNLEEVDYILAGNRSQFAAIEGFLLFDDFFDLLLSFYSLGSEMFEYSGDRFLIGFPGQVENIFAKRVNSNEALVSTR